MASSRKIRFVEVSSLLLVVISYYLCSAQSTSSASGLAPAGGSTTVSSGAGGGSTTAGGGAGGFPQGSTPPTGQGSAGGSSIQTSCPEENLRAWLKSKCGYLNSSISRPVATQRQVVDVALSAKIYRLLEVDDLAQTFSQQWSLRVAWRLTECAKFTRDVVEKDTTLSSDAKQVQSTEFPISSLWYPKLVITNSVGTVKPENYADTITLDPHTKAFFDAHGEVKCLCQLRFKYFPFDEQSCFVEVVYDTIAVLPELNFTSVSMDFSEDATSAKLDDVWTVLSYRSELKNVNDAKVRFIVSLKRNASYYALSIFIPFELLMILHLSALILPPDNFDRCAFMIYVIIAFATILSSIIGYVPKTSQTVYLFLYVMSQVTLSVVVAIYSIITNVLAEKQFLTKRVILFGDIKLSQLRMVDCAAASVSVGTFLLINALYFGAVLAPHI